MKVNAFSFESSTTLVMISIVTLIDETEPLLPEMYELDMERNKKALFPDFRTMRFLMR